MTTYGDFFTGFGGMTIGAKQAGLDVVFGVEWELELADVYRANLGDHVIVADVTKIDMATIPAVDIFHASPPCTNASVANANAGESPFDMEMATAVCDYIRTHHPRIFTMENVYQYRKFESWYKIARALLAEGYTYAFWHVNMANYGVPQTRKRMIVVARRDGIKPSLPDPTHEQNPELSLFGTKPHWVSWYEAIEDILDTLPDSKFADWQTDRLPESFGNWLMEKDKGDYSIANRHENMPAQSVTSSDSRRRAFIVDGGNSTSFNPRQETEPARTCGDVERVGNLPRAFIVNGTPNNYGETVTTITGDDPVFTQTATNKKRPMRAYIKSGRVVKMTPRAIARFQSFPDWYELPERSAIAIKGLGNAVPPLFAEKLYRHLTKTPTEKTAPPAPARHPKTSP